MSLDCEFTGIRGRPELITDTPEERYEKVSARLLTAQMRAVAERFQIIQVGLCFFVPDQSLPIKPDRPRYLAYPYNIYLFPEDRPASINNLVFDVEGINFHKQQKMDFNKWMYEGVPYLSEKEEKEMLSDLAEQAEGRREEHDELQLTMEDTRRTDLALNSINQWLREGARSECVIPDLNPFLRKFMYQKIEELYPSVQMESRSKGRFDTSIVLKLSSLAERSAIREAKLQEGLRIVQRKSGARRIFKLLTSTKAPIIGQNPLFDLLFLYSHFQGDLPAQLNDFKAKITSLFPK